MTLVVPVDPADPELAVPVGFPPDPPATLTVSPGQFASKLETRLIMMTHPPPPPPPPPALPVPEAFPPLPPMEEIVQVCLASHTMLRAAMRTMPPDPPPPPLVAVKELTPPDPPEDPPTSDDEAKSRAVRAF